MRLLTYFVFFLQVVHVTSLQTVTGYLGENITLRSNADPSWNLTKIEWSIFTNNTWIATYRNGKTNAHRVPQFKNRLSLNHSSGNLVIHNLGAHDAMEYTVDLLNSMDGNKVEKIKLTVTQRLNKPIIRTSSYAYMEGQCLMVLNCTSPDTHVHLTWDVEPSGLNYSTHINGPYTYLFMLINNTQNFKFTCYSIGRTETASEAVGPKCDGPEVHKPTYQPPQITCQQGTSNGFLCFLSGVFVATIVAIFFIHRETILQILQRLKERLFPSTTPTDVKA